MLNYFYISRVRLLIAFIAIFSILASCTGPYSVPKKDEEDKGTRIIFEEGIETEKNIQGNEQNSQLVNDQKEKVKNLSKYGPTR